MISGARLLPWGLLALGACAGEAGPPPLDPPPVPAAADDGVRIAGPGMATPLVRHLAGHFNAIDSRHGLVVEEPLGQAGALRAVEAGVIDASVVVLPAGATPPPGAVAVAATRVVLAAGPGVSLRRLTLEELARTVAGELTEWDDGTPRRPLLRAEDDAAQAALAALHPPLAAAIHDALVRGTARLVPRDDGLSDLLRRTAGAVVVTDEGQLRFRAAPVWFVALADGDRAVDVRLVIHLAPGASQSPRLAAFLAFAAGPEGRALMRDLGYEAPP